jgi:hypothetical protein
MIISAVNLPRPTVEVVDRRGRRPSPLTLGLESSGCISASARRDANLIESNPLQTKTERVENPDYIVRR